MQQDFAEVTSLLEMAVIGQPLTTQLLVSEFHPTRSI